jgi:hypothetical protein
MIEIKFFKGGQMSVFPPIHLRTESDPVSETSCFYTQQHRTIEKVQKPSSPIKST